MKTIAELQKEINDKRASHEIYDHMIDGLRKHNNDLESLRNFVADKLGFSDAERKLKHPAPNNGRDSIHLHSVIDWVFTDIKKGKIYDKTITVKNRGVGYWELEEQNNPLEIECNTVSPITLPLIQPVAISEYAHGYSTPTSTANTKPSAGIINLSPTEIINLSADNLNGLTPKEAVAVIKKLETDGVGVEINQTEKEIIIFFLKITLGGYPQFIGYQPVGREWNLKTPDGTNHYLDILLYNKKNNHYIIIEFKRDALNGKALGQITTYLYMFRNHISMLDNVTVSGYLIGTEIGTDMLAMIKDENHTLGVGIYNNGEFSTVYDPE